MDIETKVWVPAIALSASAAAVAAVWPEKALLAVAGAVVCIFVGRNPDRLIYLTVAAATAATPVFIPSGFSLGPISVKTYELLLVISAVYAAMKYRGRIPISLVAFGLLIAGWAMFGMLAQHEPSKIIYDVRNLLMLWASCFIACRVAGTRVVDGVLIWVKWILWVSAGLSLLASTVGLPLAGRVEDAALPVAGADVGESAVRLLTPATHLSLAVLCVLAVVVVTTRPRVKIVLIYAAPAILMVFISFSRNALLGVAVAVIFGLLASRTVGTVARTIGFTTLTAVVLGLLMISSSALDSFPAGAWLNKQMAGFSGRVLGGLTSETLTVDGSAQFRFQQENALIIPKISEAPVLGHGFGYAYKLPTGNPGSFYADFAPYYAHNFYLWILAKAGLVGLCLFLLFAVVPLVKSLKARSVVATAAAGGVAALLAISFVAPIPIGSPTGLLLGALIGLCASHTAATLPQVEATRTNRT